MQITDIAGVGEKKAAELAKNDITTVEQVAELEAGGLVTQRMVDSAVSLLRESPAESSETEPEIAEQESTEPAEAVEEPRSESFSFRPVSGPGMRFDWHYKAGSDNSGDALYGATNHIGPSVFSIVKNPAGEGHIVIWGSGKSYITGLTDSQVATLEAYSKKKPSGFMGRIRQGISSAANFASATMGRNAAPCPTGRCGR